MSGDVRRGRLLPLVLACVLLGAAGVLQAASTGEGTGAEQGVQRVGQHGHIDWLNMRVQARGLGMAPPATQNPYLERAMASRAAVLDARRNLLEVLKDVYVDSETRVLDFMTQSDVVVNRIEGVLQSARLDSQRELPGGGCEVLLSIPLGGQLGEELSRLPLSAQRATGAPQPPAKGWTGLIAKPDQVKGPEATFAPPTSPQAPIQPTQPTPPVVLPVPRPESLPGESSPVQPARLPASALTPATGLSQAYSGVVIDARGLNFQPSLQPELFGPNGLLFPGPKVDAKTAARNGYARYFRSLDQAQQSRAVGAMPLTIKAQGLFQGNPGRIELGLEDARVIEALLAEPGNALDECKLAIVM